MVELRQKLSPNFTRGEMVYTAHRSINNMPDDPAIWRRLERVCNECLEIIRLEFGPIIVTSGYRCRTLNLTIGGSNTSAHMHGRAADIVPVIYAPVHDIVAWVVDSDIPYDQVIEEHSSTSSWVHIAIAREDREPRRMALP